MKRTLIVIVWTVALALAALPAFAANDGSAVISAVKGKASIDRGTRSYQVVPGTALEKGDIIRTGKGAQADVSMNGLAGFRLLAASDMALESVDKKDMKLRISRGNVVLNLEKLPQDTTFAMDTPSAVAAVRGTQFWGRVDAPTPDVSVTTLAVREGSVAVTVKATGEDFLLKEGEALDIPMGASAAKTRQALKAEMAAMAQASEIPTGA